MKKILVLALAIVLTGCGTETQETTSLEKDVSTQTQTIVPSGSGEICGGESGKMCARELECVLSEEPSENHGYCVSRQWDRDLECEENRAPRCGVRGTRKTGYQNECFAQKWGAKVLSEGLCKKDESIVGSCDARVLGLEGCYQIFEGFEFDGSSCVKKRVFGCDAERPFETMEACQMACQ